MLRQRKNATTTIEAVKKLDAFPKIQDDYKESTPVGGGLSILSRILIIFLVYTEVKYYMDPKLVFSFKPDVDFTAKLKINMDLTVAMPCPTIGADILDSTNQNVFSFGVLEEEDTWWELCPNQRLHFTYMQQLNSYLREEYHSVADVLYKGSSMQETIFTLPKRTVIPNRPHDACRVHGSLTLNKVSGNFHITSGKSLHLPNGHIHLGIIGFGDRANFSHRINRLSFGPHASGIVHPLEGEEKIIDHPDTMMQYYIEVVPTDISNFMSTIKTYQYSVKENKRVINHGHGSHGIPGLYFKYDMSALKVNVRQDRDNLVQFSIRLCSIISGIVVITSFVNSFLQYILKLFVITVAPELVQHMKDAQKHRLNIPSPTPPTNQPVIAPGNLLIDVSNAATMNSPLLSSSN